MSINSLHSSFSAYTPLLEAPAAAPEAAAQERPDIRPMTLETHKNQFSGTIPGFLNFLYFPFYFIYTAESYLRAKTLGDVEGKLDARIRLAGMPLNVVNSVFSFVTFIFQAGNILHLLQEYTFSAAFMFPMNIAGIILCAIEGYFELRGADRQVDFLDELRSSYLKKIEKILSIQDPTLKEVYLLQLMETLRTKKFGFLPPQFHETLEQLKNSMCTPENGEQITRLSLQLLEQAETAFLTLDLQSLKLNHLILSPRDKEKIGRLFQKTKRFETVESCLERHAVLCEKVLQVKILALARRVQPWCAEEIHVNLNPILRKLHSHNPEIQAQGRKEAKELLALAKVQAKKLLIIHMVSAIALIISAAAFIMMLSTPLLAIPLALLSAGSVMATASYFANLGWLNTRGWRFSVSDAVTAPVKYVYEKIKDLAFSVIEKAQTTTAQIASMQQRLFQNARQTVE